MRFGLLPLEIQTRVIEHLNFDDVLNLIDAIGVDYGQVIQYIVDDSDLVKERPNINTVVSDNLRLNNRAKISIVDVRSWDKWNFRALIKGLSTTFNFIKISGMIDKINMQRTYAQIVSDLGSHSKFLFSNCTKIDIKDINLRAREIAFNQIKHVSISRCKAVTMLPMTFTQLDLLTLDNCADCIYENIDLGDVWSTHLQIKGSHLRFCDKTFNAGNVELNTISQLSNVVLNSKIAALWVSPAVEGERCTLSNFRAPGLASLKIVFHNSFPLITRFNAPKLDDISIENHNHMGIVPRDDSHMMNFTFLETASSLSLLDFFEPLYNNHSSSLTKLYLKYQRDIIDPITTDFRSLKSLTLDYFGRSSKLPIIRARRLESLKVIHLSLVPVNGNHVKAFLDRFPKLKNLQFLERTVDVQKQRPTDITWAVLSKVNQLELLVLESIECKFLEKDPSMVIEFPKLKTLAVTNWGYGTHFEMGIKADKLRSLSMTLKPFGLPLKDKNPYLAKSVAFRNLPELEVLDIENHTRVNISVELKKVQQLRYLEVTDQLFSLNADDLSKLEHLVYKGAKGVAQNKIENIKELNPQIDRSKKSDITKASYIASKM
jgi:hypothetical protein